MPRARGGFLCEIPFNEKVLSAIGFIQKAEKFLGSCPKLTILGMKFTGDGYNTEKWLLEIMKHVEYVENIEIC